MDWAEKLLLSRRQPQDPHRHRRPHRARRIPSWTTTLIPGGGGGDGTKHEAAHSLPRCLWPRSRIPGISWPRGKHLDRIRWVWKYRSRKKEGAYHLHQEDFLVRRDRISSPWPSLSFVTRLSFSSSRPGRTIRRRWLRIILELAPLNTSAEMMRLPIPRPRRKTRQRQRRRRPR